MSMRRPLSISFAACRLIAVVGFSFLLAGCFDTPDSKLPDRDAFLDEKNNDWATVPALRRVPVSADLFLSRSLRPPMPERVSEQSVSLRFPTATVTLNDLVSILDLQGVSVVLQKGGPSGDAASAGAAASTARSNASADAFANTRLAFRRFDGNVGELITKVNRSMDVVAWWEADALFISDRDRYVVSVPQHQGIIDSVVKELKSFGAEDVNASVYGGRIVYSARPQLNQDVIKPYLQGLSGNLSEVTIQLAVISLTLNKEAERGFDWSSFQLQLGDPAKAVADSLITKGTGTIGTAAGLTGAISSTDRTAGTGRIGGTFVDGIQIGKNRNDLFGISGAIFYLNQFGRTQTKQMVELHTLVGQAVKLRSGQEIPYVKSIGATTTPGASSSSTSGSGNVTGSVDTQTVSTGLTIGMTPFFDSMMELVVMDVSIEVASVPRFLTLSAGAQLGSITQPIKESRELKNIVRIKAGETVILGGVREETNADDRTAPFDAFEEVGSKRTKDQTVLNFFVLRPVVTIYESGAQNEVAPSASPMPATDIAPVVSAPPRPPKMPEPQPMPEPIIPPTPSVVAPAPRAAVVPERPQPIMTNNAENSPAVSAGDDAANDDAASESEDDNFNNDNGLFGRRRGGLYGPGR